MNRQEILEELRKRQSKKSSSVSAQTTNVSTDNSKAQIMTELSQRQAKSAPQTFSFGNFRQAQQTATGNSVANTMGGFRKADSNMSNTTSNMNTSLGLAKNNLEKSKVQWENTGSASDKAKVQERKAQVDNLSAQLTTDKNTKFYNNLASTKSGIEFSASAKSDFLPTVQSAKKKSTFHNM